MLGHSLDDLAMLRSKIGRHHPGDRWPPSMGGEIQPV